MDWRMLVAGLLCASIISDSRTALVSATTFQASAPSSNPKTAAPRPSPAPSTDVSIANPSFAAGPVPAPFRTPFPARHSAASRRTRSRGRSRTTQGASFNLLDFGAVGNGNTNDAQAFSKAWKTACSNESTATTLLVPGGKTYLVYPVSLRGPCTANITIQVEGSIVAPEDPEVWKSYQTWILITKVTDFNLVGPGTIDGRGFRWWEQSCKRNASNACRRAPTALTFRQSKRVTIRNLNFVNSQQMHLDLSACSGVDVKQLRISAPEDSPNTDGIHIERSNGVLVSDCTIATGDDCVSIGPGSYGVHLREISCGPGHGISIGSLGKKRDFEKVSNITAEGITLKETENGLRIKTWEGGQGSVEDVDFHNVTIDNVKNPIVIDQFYCDSQRSGTCKPKYSKAKAKGISISRVAYSDISGTSSTQIAVKFRCSCTSPCHTISLANVNLRHKNDQASSFCENAYGAAVGSVIPPTCLLNEQAYETCSEQDALRS